MVALQDSAEKMKKEENAGRKKESKLVVFLHIRYGGSVQNDTMRDEKSHSLKYWFAVA